MFGVLLTSLYIFRVIFLVFFGEAKARIAMRPGRKIQIPLVVLSVLSLVGGFVNLPPKLGNVPLFTRLLDTHCRRLSKVTSVRSRKCVPKGS